MRSNLSLSFLVFCSVHASLILGTPPKLLFKIWIKLTKWYEIMLLEDCKPLQGRHEVSFFFLFSVYGGLAF